MVALFRVISSILIVINLAFCLLLSAPVNAATFTVTNTNDSGAGSLRLAITQANSSAGPHTITFNIPSSDPGYYTESATSHWWRIQLGSVLPNISKSITIDGTTQTINQGDTNPGKVGTGGTVGTDNVTLLQYDKPEIEITPTTISTVNNGFVITADNAIIRGMAIYGFGVTGPSLTNSQVRLSTGNNILLEKCLIGVRANGADPGFDSKNSGIYCANLTSGSVKNNYIGNNIMGIYFNGASNWTVTGNEIFQNALRYAAQDGMDLSSGTNHITVRGNLIRQSGGMGIDSYNGAGYFTIENNTITASGAAGGNEKCGIRLFGTGSLVSKNIFYNNPGAGIMVPPLFGTIYSVNNTVSQNSCYSNGGLGIDLIKLGSSTDRGDGVNFNDGIYISTWGNTGIDFPVIIVATLVTNTLHLEGYIGTNATDTTFSNCTIEFFTAAADPTGYGEGKTYLGSCTTGATNSFTCNLDVTGKGLLATDQITGTARNTS
jgi:hypothetical protein